MKQYADIPAAIYQKDRFLSTSFEALIMKYPYSHRRTTSFTSGKSHKATMLSLILITAIIVPSSLWARDSIYDTFRLLEPSGNECSEVPSCVSVASPLIYIKAGQKAAVVVSCPEDSTNVWHWDTLSHEHIHVALVGQTGTAITVEASRMADEPGSLRLYIGCSPEPFDPGFRGQQLSTYGQPSNVIRSKQ